MKPIEELAFLSGAARDRLLEGNTISALELICRVAGKADALMNSDLTAQREAIEELQAHHEALIRFYDN